MIEEVVDAFVPGGAFLAAGVALGAAFSKQLRPVAKEAIKIGMVAGAAVQEAAAEVYERGQDLVAEARYEREQDQAAAREPEAPAPEPRNGENERRPRAARAARA